MTRGIDHTSDIYRDLAPADAAARAGAEAIIFVGSALSFSEWILRAAVVEAEGLSIKRADTLSARDLGQAARDCRVRLVVVEESYAQDLMRAPENYRDLSPDARWAIAYRSVEIARSVLARRANGGGRPAIQLLPMNVPIDVWASMFRLTLWGDFFIPCELLDDAAPPTPAPAPQPEPACAVTLTKREEEVLSLVSRGERNKIIAHRLGLSEHTVKLHIHHIINKIGVQNRTAAAHWYTALHGTDRE